MTPASSEPITEKMGTSTTPSPAPRMTRTMLPSSPMLKPTEPKIKVYILTKGADAQERDANLAKYSAWVNTLA